MVAHQIVFEIVTRFDNKQFKSKALAYCFYIFPRQIDHKGEVIRDCQCAQPKFLLSKIGHITAVLTAADAQYAVILFALLEWIFCKKKILPDAVLVFYS